MHTSTDIEAGDARTWQAAPGLPGPKKQFPLIAMEPRTWTSPATGERIRVQGSPGFQCVYVNVDGELVAIPLDLAYQVGMAIVEHSSAAQLRTLQYQREQKS